MIPGGYALSVTCDFSISTTSDISSLVTGVVLILLGLLVRSTSFLEFLRGTGFLLELVIKIDQSLWPPYKPLYSSLGSLLHDLSPTLGVLSWLGMLAGIALVVIAVRQMRGRKEIDSQSGKG